MRWVRIWITAGLAAVSLPLFAAQADAGSGAFTTGRLGGADRVLTAISISKESFPAAGSASAVVLSRSDAFADGVAGTPLAVATNAPLLLSPPAQLDANAEAEIRRVLPAGQSVYLLGGSAALSPTVEARLVQDGYRTVRVAGGDRYATATAIADTMGHPTSVLLATGLNFPDALVAGPAAAHAQGVVLLTADTTMPAETAAWLQAHPSAHVYAIGDQAAGADPAATPVRGDDRYATAVAVGRYFWPNPGSFGPPAHAGLATGLNYPDALAGGAHMGRAPSGPLLLTDPNALPSDVYDYVATQAACSFSTESWVYGQADVVSPKAASRFAEAVSGNSCP